MTRTLFLSALLCPGLALAQGGTRPDLRYSYIELRFADADENSGDGLQLKGSFDLDNNWIIVGEINSLEFGGGVDETTIQIGGGYVFRNYDNMDLIATASFVDAKVDTFFGDLDDTGFALSAGARGMVTPQLEIRGFVNYIDVNQSDTFFEIAGDYYFSPRFSAGISIEFAGDNDLISVGGRWYFR